MSVSAFAPLLLPAYYFAKPHSLPTIGAALTLQQGVLTTLHAGSAHSTGHSSLHPAAPVPPATRFSLRVNAQPDRSKWASTLLAHFASGLDEVPLQIEQTTPLPDLGAPLLAARALSLALALNAWCQTPYAPARAARLAQEALGSSAGFGVHLHGGLLRLAGSSQPRARPLSAAELRLPIRLSYFGPFATSKPKKSTLRLSRKAALQSNRLFNARPSLLTLTMASHHFAQATHPSRFWASDLLAPRPGAGLCLGSKTIFEPGLSSLTPIAHPLRGEPPRTLIVHPSNQGARIL